MTTLLPPSTRVRALRQIIDHGAAETWPDEAILKLLSRGGEAVAAELGGIGRVLEHIDGDHLIVAFKGAPCAVDVDPADVAPFLTPVS